MSTATDPNDALFPAQSDLDPYVPPGRPVPRFLALVGVAAAALAGVAVMGPFSARLDAHVTGWTNEEGRALVAVSLANHGRFDVDVTAVDSTSLSRPATFSTVVITDDGEFEAGEPIERVRLEPGQTAQVAVTLAPACSGPDPFGGITVPLDPYASFVVEVSLGLERSVSFDSLDAIVHSVCVP